MKRNEAKKLGLHLQQEGKDIKDIANILKERGYVSENSGNPLSPSGVYYLLNLSRNKRRKRRTKKAVDTGTNSKDDRFDLVELVMASNVAQSRKLSMIKSLLD